jgi:hypothetical protein
MQRLDLTDATQFVYAWTWHQQIQSFWETQVRWYCVAAMHGFPRATTMNTTRKGFRKSGFYAAVCCTIKNNDFAPPMATRIDMGQADQRNQLQKRLKFSASVPHMQLS